MPQPSVRRVDLFSRVGTLLSTSSASGVPIERISDLMGHSGTSVTETVYRHEIRPALTTGATAMNKILAATNTTRNTTRNTGQVRVIWLP